MDRRGLWFAKILLLATHPLALHQHPEINKHRIIGEWETEDFSWLIEGTPPPSDLSLWVFRAEQEEGTPTARVLLPKVVQLDDGTTPFPMTMITLEGICLTLVYHPGWASIIPWSLRAQLGSSSTTLAKGDLADLPLLPFNAINWRRQNTVVLANGLRLDGTLPPLGTITDSPIPGSLIDVIRTASF